MTEGTERTWATQAQVDLARAIYGTENVEIDEPAETSECEDGGVWVRAWVYLAPAEGADDQ